MERRRLFIVFFFCYCMILLAISENTQVQVVTGFEDNNDTQYDNKFHECKPGRNLYKLSFIEPQSKRLLQDGEGMRTECTQIEKCARICWESNSTCKAAPEHYIAVNGYYYLVGWNVTDDAGYLLFCCAASILTKFNNCTNITIDASTQKIAELEDPDKVIKDLYFENGKFHRPTLVEVCEKDKLLQSAPIPVSCKLPRRGIHPDHHGGEEIVPPPGEGTEAFPGNFGEGGNLFSGDMASFLGGVHGGMPFIPPGLVGPALAGLGGAVGGGVGGGVTGGTVGGVVGGAGGLLGLLGLLGLTGLIAIGGSGHAGKRSVNWADEPLARAKRAENFDEQSRWMVFNAIGQQGSGPKAYDEF